MEENRSFANGNGPQPQYRLGWQDRLCRESQTTFWELV